MTIVNNRSRTGQAFWLGLGNLVSLSFGIVSAAVLSRMMPVGEYGTLRQGLYVYGTLQVVFTLGLPRAYSYFLPRVPEEQALSALNRINRIFIVTGFVFAVALWCGSSMIAGVLGNPALCGALRCFAPVPAFLFPVMGMEGVMASCRRTSYATLYVILNRVFNLICVVLPVAVWHCGASGAALGLTLSSAACCVVGIKLMRLPFRGISERPSVLTASEILRYSLPLMSAGIWGILIQSAPQFFVSRWYGAEAFAEFANGFIELPFAGMLIGAIAGVLLPEVSRLASEGDGNEGKVIEIWRSTFRKSASIIYPLAIFACVYASEIIGLLYGSRYDGAAVYFRIVTVVNLIRVVPYAPVMLGLGMGRQYSMASLVPAVVLAAADMAWVAVVFPAAAVTGGAGPGVGPAGIAVIQCGILMLHISMMLYYLGRRTGTPVHRLIPLRHCMTVGGISVIASLLPAAVFGFIPGVSGAAVRLLLGSAAFISLYFPIASRMGLKYKDMLRPLIRSRIRRD